MDSPNKDQHTEGCRCGGGMWPKGGYGCFQHHWSYHILRWFLGIVIIVFVFWFGIKVGEIKSVLETGRGAGSHQMMRYGRPMMYGNGGNYGMMGRASASSPTMRSGFVPSVAPQQGTTGQ